MADGWHRRRRATACLRALRDCCEKERKLLLAEKEVQQKSRRISLAETAGRVERKNRNIWNGKGCGRRLRKARGACGMDRGRASAQGAWGSARPKRSRRLCRQETAQKEIHRIEEEILPEYGRMALRSNARNCTEHMRQRSFYFISGCPRLLQDCWKA